MSALERAWYRPGGWGLVLVPISWLFTRVARWRRRWLQRRYQGTRFAAPVVVIGNISVGGTGKTPLLIALAERLRARGRRPGIVSRGYGGAVGREPLLVTPAHGPDQVGDEPCLLARATGCPVVVCRDRRAAVLWLLANCDCDLVLSDDGLQHYRLHRDVEIAVVDGTRGLGNGRCLPAGPLREPPSRLHEVDAVVVNGGDYRPQRACYRMQLRPLGFRHLLSGRQLSPDAFLGEQRKDARGVPRVHGVAGIGNPERLRATLEALGFAVDLHPRPDHHVFRAADLCFPDALPVVITAKDAVKCEAIANAQTWVLDVVAELTDPGWDQLLDLIDNSM
ncbi:MAG: tetraacyldisaccharide 4'-kinase [Porticoccaceae bacterium]